MARRVCSPLLLCGLFLLPGLVGCQGSISGGVTAFHHADYPAAARAFRVAMSEGVTPTDVPRYDLYAGLTHLALGNAAPAVAHLTRARQTLDADPAYFSDEERARLFSAWRALGKMPGQKLEP